MRAGGVKTVVLLPFPAHFFICCVSRDLASMIGGWFHWISSDLA